MPCRMSDGSHDGSSSGQGVCSTEPEKAGKRCGQPPSATPPRYSPRRRSGSHGPGRPRTWGGAAPVGAGGSAARRSRSPRRRTWRCRRSAGTPPGATRWRRWSRTTSAANPGPPCRGCSSSRRTPVGRRRGPARCAWPPASRPPIRWRGRRRAGCGRRRGCRAAGSTTWCAGLPSRPRWSRGPAGSSRRSRRRRRHARP